MILFGSKKTAVTIFSTIQIHSERIWYIPIHYHIHSYFDYSSIFFPKLCSKFYRLKEKVIWLTWSAFSGSFEARTPITVFYTNDIRTSIGDDEASCLFFIQAIKVHHVTYIATHIVAVLRVQIFTWLKCLQLQLQDVYFYMLTLSSLRLDVDVYLFNWIVHRFRLRKFVASCKLFMYVRHARFDW